MDKDSADLRINFELSEKKIASLGKNFLIRNGTNFDYSLDR
jgi:hypothetical protein